MKSAGDYTARVKIAFLAPRIIARMLRHISRRLWLLIPLAVLVFALPTWWMREWLPRQGGLPTLAITPSPTPTDPTYEQALALAVEDPEAALPLLNEVAFSDSQHAETARAIWNAIQGARLADDPAYMLTTSGQALAAAGEWELARQALVKAVELNPQYAEAWAYLGEAMQQAGQDGLPALLNAQRLDANSLSVRLFLALYWQRLGDYKQAGLNLKMAALHNPAEPLIQLQLGENAVLAGDAPGGLDYFKKALELAPEDDTIWLAVASYCVESELYIEQIGLPSARHLLLSRPQDPDVLVLNARALALAGDDDSAEAFFIRALQVDAMSVAAHLYYAIFLLGNQQQEARSHLDTVLALSPIGEQADLAAYWLEQISH
jgi:tetratricopeptide (TPR) repeat protein